MQINPKEQYIKFIDIIRYLIYYNVSVLYHSAPIGVPKRKECSTISTPKKKKKKPAPKAYKPEPGHENDVRIGPLEKKGEKMMRSIEAGKMVGVLSGNEVMYTFIYRNMYECFIHPLAADEGRHKAFEMNEQHRAMIKSLADNCDQLFEIEFGPEMDFMGVMVAAEQGIINFLDSIGQLPIEDHDFMAEN